MYPQGGYRNSYPVYGIGDRSQTSRQPSRLSAPTSQSQPQPRPQFQPQPQQQQQQLPKPEARKEEPSKPTQPARVLSKPEPQVPKQAESKPDQQKVTATETRKESPTPVPPPPATSIVKVSTPTQSLNISASENNKSEQLSIVPADQGKAIVKASSSEPDKSLQQGIKEDITNLTRRLAELQAQHKLLNGDQKAMPGQSDLGVRVITLAGENRGATMDLGSESRNNAIYDSQRMGHKDSTTNEKDENGKGSHSPSTATASPVNAYVNSNVQGANNSILYNSTCAHRDPGVRLTLSNTPFQAAKEIGPPKETRAKLKAAAKDPA
ncbi:hypothetical protein SUGI_0351900 [Cryptomeria japonica]|uniref:uncharacterized protein LOC131037058 n=1 Tax=Cryptomeria japonica TaxID=3369 RepID=UPI002408BC81|nr:uncharacterized protein LOC131037058 [Cryptomeria japonica]GLJ19484.1 hypothetical protein SUGI_0351900 [Cryptomeria japonica]